MDNPRIAAKLRKKGYSIEKMKHGIKYGLPINLVKPPVPIHHDRVDILRNGSAEKIDILLDFIDGYWEKDNIEGMWPICEHLDSRVRLISPYYNDVCHPCHFFSVDKAGGKKGVVVDVSMDS